MVQQKLLFEFVNLLLPSVLNLHFISAHGGGGGDTRWMRLDGRTGGWMAFCRDGYYRWLTPWVLLLIANKNPPHDGWTEPYSLAVSGDNKSAFDESSKRMRPREGAFQWWMNTWKENVDASLLCEFISAHVKCVNVKRGRAAPSIPRARFTWGRAAPGQQEGRNLDLQNNNNTNGQQIPAHCEYANGGIQIY